MTKELYEEAMGLVLRAAGIEGFTAREICNVGREAKHWKTGKIVTLKPPPAKMFGNILPTLEIAEWLRDRCGPLLVNSGYRDPEYNDAIRGEPDSLHMRFNALDLRSPKISPRELYETVTKHLKAGQMGIGLYDGFIHIDTRSVLCKPTPARWNESKFKLAA